MNKTSEEISDVDELVYVALVGWNLLCGLGWLWVQRDPPPSGVLRLKVNATIPGLKCILFPFFNFFFI